MSQRLNSSTPPPTLALEPWSRRIGRVWRRQVADLRSAYGLSDTTSGRVWTVDLIVLALLVSATILFGGALRNLRVPSTSISLTGEQVRELYEPAMALIFVAALWRLGVRGIVKRLRATLPLLAFAVFWLGGLIATARGTVTYGPSQILPDLGLFEYSLFVPLVAVVVDSKERALRLLAVISAAAAVITVGFGILWEFDSNGAFLTKNPYAAITLYMALFALPVVARLSLRCRVLPLEIVVGACALVLITLSVVRSAVLALVLALALIVLLAPRGRRLPALAFAAGGLAIALGGGLAIEAWNPQIKAAAAGATSISDFAATDSSPQFSGGTVVTGDAAEGKGSPAPVFEGTARARRGCSAKTDLHGSLRRQAVVPRGDRRIRGELDRSRLGPGVLDRRAGEEMAVLREDAQRNRGNGSAGSLRCIRLATSSLRCDSRLQGKAAWLERRLLGEPGSNRQTLRCNRCRGATFRW